MNAYLDGKPAPGVALRQLCTIAVDNFVHNPAAGARKAVSTAFPLDCTKIKQPRKPFKIKALRGEQKNPAPGLDSRQMPAPKCA